MASLRFRPYHRQRALRSVQLEVEGTVRFAFLTFTSETGDIEQQVVPVRFSKLFYPREGWIVGLSAQKTRVTRIDPLRTHGAIEVLDDGKFGSMRVAIKVNAIPRATDETSEPFGIARATIRVP
jgi:hypothetical protein